MARFTQYPTATSPTDYTDATTFLIANENGEIKQASFEMLRDAFGAGIKVASLTVASADILTANSNPVTFGLTVPSGYAPRVIAMDGKMDYGTTPYATNGNLVVRCTGTTASQAGWTANQFLFGTISRSVTATLTSPVGITDNQLISGADLEMFISTGNPTAGDSDIELTVVYRLVEV